jgi:long-chain acyl-CoA synthetase
MFPMPLSWDNINYSDFSELIKNDTILNFMESEINRATPGLASYEKIKKVALLDRDFEIEKGEITPTLKVKRNIIEQKYRSIIDGIYQE